MRLYSVGINAVSCTLAQDLFAIYSGTQRIFRPVSIDLSQSTFTSLQANLKLSFKRLPTTVTTGSGGTSATINKQSLNDSSAGVTARINDTTQATTSGTAVIWHPTDINPLNGYQWYWPEATRPWIGLSEAFIVSLDTAPTSAAVFSGTLYFEEAP